MRSGSFVVTRLRRFENRWSARSFASRVLGDRSSFLQRHSLLQQGIRADAASWIRQTDRVSARPAHDVTVAYRSPHQFVIALRYVFDSDGRLHRSAQCQQGASQLQLHGRWLPLRVLRCRWQERPPNELTRCFCAHTHAGTRIESVDAAGNISQ